MATAQKADRGALAARISLVLAVVAAAAVLFLPIAKEAYDDPLGQGVRSTSLLQQQGPGVVLLAAFPIVLAAIPVVGERLRPGSRGLRILGAVFLWLFVMVGLVSIGWFYAPSAIAMTVAAAARRPGPAELEAS